LHRSERLALANAYIALTRVMVDSVFGKKPADHSLLLIGSSIMVGHAENRPMNATKISHYVGLPRSTVIRKLNELSRTGVVVRHGNVYLLSEARPQSDEVRHRSDAHFLYCGEKFESLQTRRLEGPLTSAGPNDPLNMSLKDYALAGLPEH